MQASNPIFFTPPKYLTPAEVSRLYSIPLGSLANMRSAKRGPAFTKVGKCVRYKTEDIEHWFESGKVSTTSDREG